QLTIFEPVNKSTGYIYRYTPKHTCSKHRCKGVAHPCTYTCYATCQRDCSQQCDDFTGFCICFHISDMKIIITCYYTNREIMRLHVHSAVHCSLCQHASIKQLAQS